jgi:hypothetical protein
MMSSSGVELGIAALRAAATASALGRESSSAISKEVDNRVDEGRRRGVDDEDLLSLAVA